jgi:hypothetical protein
VCDVNTDTFPDFVYKGDKESVLQKRTGNEKTVCYNKTRRPERTERKLGFRLLKQYHKGRGEKIKYFLSNT